MKLSFRVGGVRSAALAAAAVTCLPLSLPVSAASVDSAVLAACRRIPETAPRLECFDRLTDALTGQTGEVARSAPPAAAPPMPSPAPAAVTPAAPAVVAPPPAPAPSLRHQATPEKQLRPAQPTQLKEKDVQLTKVTRSGEGALILVTADEGSWIQIDGRDVRDPPQAGATINIKRAALGSYMCQLSEYVAVRCIPRK